MSSRIFSSEMVLPIYRTYLHAVDSMRIELIFAFQFKRLTRSNRKLTASTTFVYQCIYQLNLKQNGDC